MRRLVTILFAALVLGFTPFVGRAAEHAHAAGVTVHYRAGWNLVGGPAGTMFNASGPLYTLDAGGTGFEAKPGDAPVEGGRGYWAYFTADTTIVLAGGSVSGGRIDATAGRWAMVGNPYGAQPAVVSDADVLLTWDPTAARYMQVALLAAGQGGWALPSNRGIGLLTLQPMLAITKGEVLFADDYGAPSAGRLPATPYDCCTRSYENGEYVVRVTDSAATSVAGADLPGTYSDTLLTVDAQLVGKTDGRYVSLACRNGRAGNFRLLIDAAGGWTLRYLHLEPDGSAGISWVLAGGESPAIHTGAQTNHIELACVGSNIQASVNGTPIVALSSPGLPSGVSTIAAGTYSDVGTDRTVEGRFVNVVLYRAAVASAPADTGSAGPRPSPTPAVAPSGSRATSVWGDD